MNRCMLVVVAFLLAAGCKPTNPPIQSQDDAKEKTDPWEEAGKYLKKGTDLASCKTALGQLKDLAGRAKDEQPPGLSAESAAALVAVAPLAPDDLAEVRPATFTPLDPVYIADCFYLRDAARSLEVPGLTPSRRAELAFAWVCRQIYLDPWRLANPDGSLIAPALPPASVLRRGSGSGLERAYVFLALLQQMNLEGCLIGPPDAGTKAAVSPFPANAPTVPRGPFWAVGVRVENELLLFDPWRGQPFPGTLAQVKANPDLLKAWFEEKGPVSPLTAEDIKNAAVYLAVPVSALAPRLAFFEEKLKAETGLNLAIDAAAMKSAFEKAVPPGTPVSFWNPPASDPFAYVRVLPAVTPVNEGGRDRSPPGASLLGQYQISLLPASVLDLPRLRSGVATSRLQQGALGSYAAAFFVPPTPRELIQRGQFQEAARFLIEKQGGFARGLERLRQANPQLVFDWIQRADAIYTELARARRPNVNDREDRPDSDPQVAEVLAAIDQFWKAEAITAQVIIDRATARVGLTESTFLIALSKHEEAERMQLRTDNATGPNAAQEKSAAFNAWGEAAAAWRSYLDQAASQDPFPNRVAHARALAARANELAQKK